MNKDVYWVGLETDGSPHGFGEDHRYCFTVAKGTDPKYQIRAAIIRLAKQITFEDGDRIAIRKMQPKG